MSDRIKALRQKKAVLIGEADALLAKLESDDGLTDEENTRYEEIETELEQVNTGIAREERLMDERRSLEPVAEPAGDVVEIDTGEIPRIEVNEPEPRFENFGEQLAAVAAAAMNRSSGVPPDTRLQWQAATGANEAVPSEGGFLVQTDFATDLLQRMNEMGDIISRVRDIPISAESNGIKLPYIDEVSRADGARFGGVQAFWANEADTATGTKPKFGEMELSLKKLIGIAFSTEELLKDSTALGAIMTTAFTEELTFKTEDAIVNGTGTGQPLGLLNSGGVVITPAESGQTAGTITTQNVLNMFARLPRRSVRNAVWLINQDVFPQLWGLTLGTGTAVVLLYRPPEATQGMNAPFGTLMGRPVIPVEYAATLGAAGDIMLVDLQEYLMIDKGGIEQAESMHVRFLFDEMTFRFIYRVDGQPAWRKPITPKNGTNTQSPYIVLAAR